VTLHVIPAQAGIQCCIKYAVGFCPASPELFDWLDSRLRGNDDVLLDIQ
jgi:hypothetical protein